MTLPSLNCDFSFKSGFNELAKKKSLQLIIRKQTAYIPYSRI